MNYCTLLEINGRTDSQFRPLAGKVSERVQLPEKVH